MIGRLLGAVRKRKIKSSYDVLKRLLPARELQKLAMATPDRRHIFAVAARVLGLSELELMQKIAARMGLTVVEHPVAMDLELLSGGCTVADLRAAGVLVSTDPGGLKGCICIDPAQVDQLPEHIKTTPRYLGTWTAIARALDESERVWRVKVAENDRKQAEARREMVEGVLAIVVAETLQFGALRVEIDCSQGEPSYRFRTADGRIGAAPLSSKLHEPLRRYCEDRLDSGERVHIRIPSGQRYALTVCSTIVQGVFLIVGESEDVQSEGSLGARLGHLEAPVLHTIEGGKSERKVVHLKAEQIVSSQKKPSKLRRPRVLVIDDNAVFANVLDRFLGRMEIEVKHRSDGADAPQLLIETKADLLICDVHMPETPGFEVVRRVRESEALRDIPIIMLTSDTDIETEVRLLTSGADAFVSKSEDPRKLCAHVHRLLVRVGKRKEAA